jgi:polysaccharide export outer membrane protein
LSVFSSVDTLFAMIWSSIRRRLHFNPFLNRLFGSLALAVSLLASLCFTSCATENEKNGSSPVLAQRAEEPVGGAPVRPGTDSESSQVLNVGDRITIIYMDAPVSLPPSEQQIRDDGKISLHLNLEVMAAGKKPGDLEKEIRRLYIDGKYYKQISISVQTQLRFFSVGGEVRSPGSTFPHPGQMTVLKAINAAGGFTEYANKSKVIVTRYADKKQVIVNCKKALKDPRLDLPVYPGDQVMVKRTWI